MKKSSKAVVTVIGKDNVGILADVSGICAASSANIIEVSQEVMDTFFCMIMIIDVEKMKKTVEELRNDIAKKLPSMEVHVMHENIFNSMHKI